MEGKTVILSVLIMTLVMAQIQVEAMVICPNAAARKTFEACLSIGGSLEVCAHRAGCRLQNLELAKELARGCCPTEASKNTYNTCLNQLGFSQEICAKVTGCYIQSQHDGPCREGYIPNIPFPPHTNDAVNEYCKLGCASSVCGALTTLRNSDTSEVVNGAVAKCAKACSTLCTKGSMAALETA